MSKKNPHFEREKATIEILIPFIGENEEIKTADTLTAAYHVGEAYKIIYRALQRPVDREGQDDWQNDKD